MAESARPLPSASPAERLGVDPARLAESNINPSTGLATDFLNHFNEAIMLLEMLPMAPECKDDFLAWQPMTYREHFEASRLKQRKLAIAAYEVADPVVRAKVERIFDKMNKVLIATRDGIAGGLSVEESGELAAEVAWRLKPMVAEASALINDEPAEECVQATAQAAVDALFDHEVVAAVGS
jgi:hypothetical protein